MEIEVKALNKNQANEVFDGIKIEFTNDLNHVSATTNLEFSNGKTSTKNFLDYIFSMSSNNEFKINYEVWVPHNNQIDIHLKYGNLMAQSSIGGSANIEVKYGNFNLGEVKGNTKVLLGYGKGTISKTKQLDAEIKYSTLNAEEIIEADLNSKYSSINIQKVKNLKVYSGYDTYKINGLESAQIEAKYGGYQLGMGVNPTKLNLIGNYTSFQVRIPHDNPFDFYVSGKYTGFKFPESTHFTLKNSNSSFKEYKGSYRSNRGFQLNAELNYGSLTIGN